MGLLDDAIREHLDLKRRHGADPAEVARLEREALGPVRRGPAGLDPLDDDAGERLEYYEDADPQGPRDYLPDAPEWDDEFDDPPRSHEPAGERPARGATLSGDQPDFAGSQMRPTPQPHAADLGPEGRRRQQHPSDETAEFDVDQALAEEQPRRDDDVLEETPEFLQDAPDRDKLWFEQRPPRDFDFDG